MNIDDVRKSQREQCQSMLEAWMPIAINTQDDDALKAIPVILKVMERMAKLDGLDVETSSVSGVPAASPEELKERVNGVMPGLLARLRSMDKPKG